MNDLSATSPTATVAPMPSSTIDREQIDRNTASARQVVLEMAGMLDGLADTAIPIPGSEWTVGEHGAHIAFANIGFSMFAMGLEYPHGDGTQSGLAEANEVALIGFPERDGSALADHLRVGIGNFVNAVDAAPVDQVCPSPLGSMPLGTLTSYFLVHNLMHGSAISIGLNRDLPFEEEHLAQIWPLILHALPTFMNAAKSAGLSGTVEFEVSRAFRGAFQVDGGELEILPDPPGPVDCRVEAQPMHFFLVLIKLLTVDDAGELGQMKVSGSQPDLFGRLVHALDIP